jgi:threonine dehydrogenase-like Zn-dependent dehydrogenase
VAEVPDPSPAADEVVVEVDACGLCGSDVHALQHGQPADGQILGHEFSGTIVALGAEVTGWRTGQPVAASPIGSCGKCRICSRGLPFRCPAAPNIGINRQGAYAQYAAVPARQLVALPEDLPLETGAHAEPLSVAMQAVKLSGAGRCDPVLVYGAGPIGLYAIMALRLAGAGPIVAAGRSAGRRAAAASVPLFHMLSEGLRLAGACAFSDETYRAAVDHLVHGRVPAGRLVSERVSLADTPGALVRLRSPGELVRILCRPRQEQRS